MLTRNDGLRTTLARRWTRGDVDRLYGENSQNDLDSAPTKKTKNNTKPRGGKSGQKENRG